MRYLEELKDLDLPQDQYAVFGSGPMAIRGMRPNEDIDIIVSNELWKRIEGDHRKDDRGMVALSEHIETSNSVPYVDDAEAWIADADVIDGIRYVRLVRMLEWKKKMGREKDMRDIELILDYMKDSDEGF
jgi:hypothetical protein